MLLKLKILPISYVIIFAVLMYAIVAIVDSPGIELGYRSFVAVAVFFCGILIVLIGGAQFRKALTTVNPLKPEESSNLVVTGLYQYSRNPMYVGFLMFLVSWVIFLGSLMAVLLLPIFIYVITKMQIEPEEKILEDKFGDEFRNYSKRVRRWI